MCDDQIDTVAAALAIGVQPSTIRTWANRGRLDPVGRDSKGRTLYSLTQVRLVHSKSACRT